MVSDATFNCCLDIFYETDARWQRWSDGLWKIKGQNDELTIPNNGAAILIRKDPVYVENYIINNDKFEGTRNDSSKIRYIFSRMPSIWFNSKSHPHIAGLSLTLVDGQKIHCSQESLFSIEKITEHNVILQTTNSKELSIPFDKIHSLNF